MSDTTTVWFPLDDRGDWQLSGAALQTGSDLETAILISIFTDREANPDDVIPDGTDDPRGWCGDDGELYKIGSRLWLLGRSKHQNEVRAKAKEYVQEALQWLLDDSVVAKFDIAAEWVKTSLLGVKVVAYQKDGSTVALNFSWVWKGIN